MNKTQLEEELRLARQQITEKDQEIAALKDDVKAIKLSAERILELSQRQGAELKRLAEANTVLTLANGNHARTMEAQASTILFAIAPKQQPPPHAKPLPAPTGP